MNPSVGLIISKKVDLDQATDLTLAATPFVFLNPGASEPELTLAPLQLPP